MGRRREYPRTQEEEDYGDSRNYDAWSASSPRFEPARSRRWSAVGIFWLTSLVVVLAASLLGLIWAGAGAGGNPNGQMGLMVFFGLILLAIFLPALQLIAAFITFLILAISSRPDKSYQFGQIGKISLGLVGGTIVGVVIMVAGGFILSKL